jgi:hypothetical protein
VPGRVQGMDEFVEKDGVDAVVIGDEKTHKERLEASGGRR